MADSSAVEAAAVARRRQLIALARRRARPGTGSHPDMLRERNWSDPSVDLHQLKTPFLVVGGVATWLYMPQRQTKDVDLLVQAADSPSLSRELEAVGCARISVLSVGGALWRLPDGDTMDVLELDQPWVTDAMQSPNRGPTGLPVIALPYLVLMKLTSSRVQDAADISRMLGQADEATRNEVRTVVRAHRPEDLDDLESLIILGDLELADPENPQGE